MEYKLINTQDYFSRCNQTIQKFIIDSTRKELDELVVEPTEAFDFSYKLVLNVTLSVRISDEIIKGKGQNTAKTIVFMDEHGYTKALNDYSQQELNNPQTLQEVYQFIDENDYGVLADSKLWRNGRKQVLYTYNCDNCCGAGNVKCNSCSGSGKKSCSNCSGNGKRLMTRTAYDHFSKKNRTEQYYEDCSHCYGSGKTKCSNCGGSGKTTCKSCDATGYLTTVSTIGVLAVPEYSLVLHDKDTPKYITEALYKANLAKLGLYGEVAIENSKISYEKHSAYFIYKAITPFAKLRSQLYEHSIQWILYGKKPCIFDAGHILEIILKKDLNQLRAITKVSTLFNPFISFFTKKTIEKFMSSEAHQSMLDGNSLNHHGNDLREYLKRSFSITYIEDALTALRKLTRAVQRWSMVTWFIFSVLICYCTVSVESIINHHEVNKVRVFTTHPSVYDSPLSVSAIWDLFKSYGLSIAIVMLIMTFIGSFWIRLCFKRMGTRSLLKWGKHYKYIINRWFSITILGIVTMLFLLYYFPIQINQQNNLFGLINIDKITSFF